MSSLKKIREKFGISQQQIAGWLGISRSLAEHYERGICTLPANALLQLSKLEMMIIEFEKNGEKKPAFLGMKQTMSPGLKTQDSTNKSERLQQQLSFLKNRHAALQQQMLLIKNLMDNCNEQTSEKEKRWLQMLYNGVCCKLSKVDEARQLPLKAKILEMRVKQELMNRKVVMMETRGSG